MEISQDFLIDLALNIGGYVLAGALSVLLYSIFMRKKNAPAPVPTTSVPPAETISADIEPPVQTRRIEFIRLGDKAEDEPKVSRETSTGTARRDRAEIIRIARNMLKAGAPIDRIKRVLPVSESELALLDMSKR